MAPDLAASQHNLIRDMILARTLPTAQIAMVAGCSERSIKAMKSNLRHFNSTKAPANRSERHRLITLPMPDALIEHLLEKPGLYQEVTFFLWAEFDVLVSTFSISRSLKAFGWSKKAARQIASEQNADLRDFYLYSAPPHVLIGCSPSERRSDKTPSLIFFETISNSSQFTLHLWPSQRTLTAGVKLMYLPPYLPGLNPMKEFFAELKAFIKKNRHAFEDAPEQGFDTFLELCVDVVGGKQDSARGHFRHAGITVEML